MRSASFIALTGTRMRATPTSAIWSQTQGTHHFIHFAWARGPLNNRGAGVSIGKHKRHILSGKICQTSAPPAAASGREGMVRICNAGVDVTIFALYSPPPAVDRACVAWKKTVDMLLAWLDDEFTALPYRSTPLLFTDLNDSCSADNASEYSAI
eukprot:8258399-Pyramimonas_sp.AAC.1